MMWKDSYLVGVERIDRQHKELFRMTEALVSAVQSGAPEAEYRRILAFLKDYVIYHFRDEEEYQASVGYSGLAAHREEHRQFTRTVLDYEKKLTETGFDRRTMKDLAGTVTAWLIYHVADTDQKMAAGREAAAAQRSFDRYADLFGHSALEVLGTMAGLETTGAEPKALAHGRPRGEVFVTIRLVGDLQLRAVFGFSRELALGLLRSMVGMELTEVDELVRSALCEVTNIACGNAASALAGQGLQCDIRPPEVTDACPEGDQSTAVALDTALGRLEVGVQQ